MSTRSSSENMPRDWLSMWLEWPLLWYREWLQMLEMSQAPADPVAVQEFGVTESANEMVVVAQTSAFKPGQLEATIQESMLDIRGERHEQVEGGELHVSYDRKIPLPPTVNAQKATTTVRDGIVEVRIPKRQGIDALA